MAAQRKFIEEITKNLNVIQKNNRKLNYIWNKSMEYKYNFKRIYENISF